MSKTNINISQNVKIRTQQSIICYRSPIFSTSRYNCFCSDIIATSYPNGTIVDLCSFESVKKKFGGRLAAYRFTRNILGTVHTMLFKSS